MEALIQIAIVIILLLLGYFMGSASEKRHYRKIFLRERALRNMPVLSTKDLSMFEGIESSELVEGHCAVSVDYFKRFLAVIKNIFGGQLNSYESLLDRGRREAIIRMKTLAHKKGYHAIVNMRLQTASIGKSNDNRQQISCIDLLAYGTALRLKNPKSLLPEASHGTAPRR